MPSDPAPTLASLSARLDKQAAAIRALRAQVADLQAHAPAAPAVTGASASTPAAHAAAPGVFVPRPDCGICGEAKEPGRTALTCKACSAIYQAGIRGEGERLLFDACMNCGTAKPASTRMLCSPCIPAFKQWKAAQ